jgi:hypothetical protein
MQCSPHTALLLPKKSPNLIFIINDKMQRLNEIGKDFGGIDDRV